MQYLELFEKIADYSKFKSNTKKLETGDHLD